MRERSTPTATATRPLRWAQGQGPHRHGTRWHLVREERAYGELTMCGQVIVQSDALELTDYRVSYIESGMWPACEGCYAQRPGQEG